MNNKKILRNIITVMLSVVAIYIMIPLALAIFVGLGLETLSFTNSWVLSGVLAAALFLVPFIIIVTIVYKFTKFKIFAKLLLIAGVLFAGMICLVVVAVQGI